MVFLKEFCEKVNFEKKAADNKKHVKLPSLQSAIRIVVLLQVKEIRNIKN